MQNHKSPVEPKSTTQKPSDRNIRPTCSKVSPEFYERVARKIRLATKMWHQQIEGYFKGEPAREAVFALYMNNKITIGDDGLVTWRFI